MKIALVHDDLIQFGGAERLLLAIHEIWPDAPIYTSVASRKWKKLCRDLKIDLHTSFMQYLPFVEKFNRFYSTLLLHVLAFESFNFNEFDVVICVSARYSHAIITRPQTKLICYMNSPGRMFWEPASYFENENMGGKTLKRLLMSFLNFSIGWLKLWDFSASHRVDYFVSNSKTPHDRIKKYYNMNSLIIYPFVDTEKIELSEKTGDYYLIISRLLSWKKIELAIKACNELNVPLKIIGEGPAYDQLKKIAGPKIEFLGYLAEKDKIVYLQNCKALINTQFEDFGIVPLEAMSAGKPVIAYGKGGALETVIPNKTGIFFTEQTVQALQDVLSQFDPKLYLPVECHAQAQKFSKALFKHKIKEFCNAVYLKG